MNPYHLLWIVPLSCFFGVIFGVSTGLWWGGRRWVTMCLRLMSEVQAAKAAKK